jgi:Spy/CpxP family protein refolding chaperone
MLLMALSAFAAPVAAQEKSMQHKEGMGQDMMGGFGILKALQPFAPDALLKHGDHIKLTSDQVARLTSLRDQASEAVKQAHHSAHEAHMSLNETLKNTPDDTTALRRYFLEHHNGEGAMQWLRISAALQARAVLTPEQRTLAESMAKEGTPHQH